MADAYMEHLKGKTILIVDDAVSIRKQVRVILEKAGCQVREAGSEIGMLNAMDEYGKRVELVLMDLSLNLANGFDLIAKLREFKEYHGIPIVILSQYADRERVSIARLAGVKGYLVKPVDPTILQERLSQVFSEL